MSTETVTVLFTDLVASTELMSRLGEAAADELRREHFGLLRGAVAEHGGREVKNLGDGLMVVFDAVTGGLACAVAMQQAIAGRAPDAEPLSIRVGVALGDAEFDDGDYFGLPVVEASRLCARADGGEILTTEFVRLLARSRSDVELVSVGALDLKGLDEPVETFRVRWAPIIVTEERAPLPSRLVSARSSNFVGRDAERSQLAVAWKTVVGGARRVMLVAGEPGIGKTTLSAQFASDVCDDGGLVVYGRSDEDLGVPYQPWIEALGQLVTYAPEAVLAAHATGRGAHLARLTPQLADRLHVEVPSGGDADSERFVLYGCVTDLLARVSAERPVLIVLEDLHWADRATVQLLRQVATADQAMRVGVLATYRDSEIGTTRPLSELLAALHREGGTERLALRGFGRDELLALLETIAGHEMDDQGVALGDALLAETAGNPFFVAEILRHLAESGAIYQRDDGRWVADADLRAVGLPVSVREVVGRRIATLGPESERVLALASVIGRDFDISLLAAVVNLDEDTVIDLCDAAVTAAVLATTDRFDRYTFAHALIEHTLYDSLSPARRARAHNTIAATLEALLGEDPGDRTAELAYHWAAAVRPTDTAKAVHYAHLAGDHALAQLAPDEAVRWYSQALELLNRARHADDRQRAELLVGLGDAQRQCGIAAHRETLLEVAQLADQIDAVDLLVRAVLANNRGFMSILGEGDHERIAAIDRALDRVGDTPSASRAELLALSASERVFLVDLDERLTRAEEAIDVARACGDRTALAWALQRPYVAITHPSTLAQRRTWTDEACEIAGELDDPSTKFWGRTNALMNALERGDGAAIDNNLSRVEEIAARVPHAAVRWTLTFQKAWVAGLHGDLAEYDRLADAALAVGIEAGQPDAMPIYAAQLTNVRFYQGRLHELIPLIEQVLADIPTLHVYRAVLAWARQRAGQLDEARAMIREDLAAGFPMPADQSWLSGFTLWADLALQVREFDAVSPLRQRLLPYRNQMTSALISFQPAVSFYLGRLDHLLGRYDDAEHWFTEALELHQRVRSPVLIAQTHASWAEMLTDRDQGDDHARARKIARAALDAAITGGYGYIETDARAVLDRLS
jgi:class 3 adenylate cyclase/tetratricopeptide (TPR) repeat protein